MTRRRALAIAAISLAGCDNLLRLDDIHPSHDALVADMPPDGMGVLCAGDDFQRNSIDTTLWTPFGESPTATVADDGMTLAVTLESTPSTTSYAGVYTSFRDFSDMSTSIEVDQFPGVMGGTVELSWSNGGTDHIHILVDGMTIFLGQVAGTGPDETALSYDPGMMSWWRIRHDPSSVDVALETSPDGVTWTTRKSVVATISLGYVSVLVQAGTYQMVAPTGAKLDNFAMIGTCK